jgi:hypothetical protein
MIEVDVASEKTEENQQPNKKYISNREHEKEKRNGREKREKNESRGKRERRREKGPKSWKIEDFLRGNASDEAEAEEVGDLGPQCQTIRQTRLTHFWG